MTRSPAPRPTLRHWGEGLLLGVVAGVVKVLPEGLALALGAALGWAAGSLLRLRRRVVEDNLLRAFPGGSQAWRRRVAVRAYVHLGRQGVSLLRLSGMSPRAIWDRTEVEGLDAVREALAHGRGVIVLSGHFGNWEMGGAALAVREIPLDVVARRQANPLFETRLRRVRERLGMRVTYRAEGVRPILRALREPRAVALVADQNVREGGVFVDFFGTPASTARGPATLARRTGARVVLGTARALPGRRARFRIRIRPLEIPDAGDPEADDRVLLAGYLTALEAEVREAPDQYFWFHRRWKTRPEETGPEPSPREVGTTQSQEGEPEEGTHPH